MKNAQFQFTYTEANTCRPTGNNSVNIMSGDKFIGISTMHSSYYLSYPLIARIRTY